MRTIMLIENKDQGNNEKVYHMHHGIDRFLILHVSLKEGVLLVLSVLGTILSSPYYYVSRVNNLILIPYILSKLLPTSD